MDLHSILLEIEDDVIVPIISLLSSLNIEPADFDDDKQLAYDTWDMVKRRLLREYKEIPDGQDGRDIH